MEDKKIKSVQNKCKSCGGNLIYYPKTMDLFCEKCSSHYEIVDEDTVLLHDLLKKAKSDEKYRSFVDQNKLFKCPNCGANVVLNQFEISQKCPYCDASLVIETNNIPGIKPDAIIPFEFDESEASEIFVNNIKKRFFVPNKFKKHLPANQIHGIYIPTFGYFANTTSVYNGELYDEVTTTDTDGHQSNDRTYFKISGTHSAKFEDVLVECSSKITQKEINGFLPYKTVKRKPYNNNYILGYSVEHYNQTVEECIPSYKSIVNGLIRNQILRKYKHDGVNYLNISTEYSDERYLYYLLPVYRFEYEYKSKKYVTYMNGQTGRVDGNVPKSAVKITFVTILTLLIVFLPIILGIIFGD